MDYYGEWISSNKSKMIRDINFVIGKFMYTTAKLILGLVYEGGGGKGGKLLITKIFKSRYNITSIFINHVFEKFKIQFEFIRKKIFF